MSAYSSKPQPMVSPELIEHLQELYDTRTQRSDSDREIWGKVGHREVLEKLQAMLDEDTAGIRLQ